METGTWQISKIKYATIGQDAPVGPAIEKIVARREFR
jgi:hypothetical protein